MNVFVSLLTIFSFFVTAPAWAAEVEFTAELESPQVAEGENVAVDFVVSTSSMSSKVGEPEYTAPDFDEVNVFQRGTSIQSVYVNGQFSVKRSVRITVVLYPKKTGELKIDNPSVVVDGKKYTSPDLTVEVVASGQAGNLARRGGNMFQNPQARPAPLPNSGVNPNVGRQSSIFIRTETDKSKVYKGEQIRLTYALYTRAQIANIQVERYPTAGGFLKEDIDIPLLRGKLDWSRSVVNGIEYRRAVLAEYALFPVKEGKLPLDVFQAKLSYRGSGGGLNNLLDDDDVFGLNNFFQAFQVLTESRESDRRTIEVLPLPAEGQPANFSGLVGNFDINAAVDKYSVKAGDAVNVKVKVEGEGHAGSLEKLVVNWPADFELYEDRSSTKFRRNGTSERVFDFLVIPRAKGSFQVPAIEISMFDPERKVYQTRKTEPITIEVLEGAGMSAPVAGLAGGNAKATAAAQPKKDIRHILAAPEAELSGKPGFDWGAAAGQLLAGVSMFLLGGVLLGFQRSSPSAAQLESKASRALKERVRRLDSLIEKNPVKALSEVDAALADLLRQKTGVLKGSLTRPELRESLVAKGVADVIAQRVDALIEHCENQRFLPPEIANNPGEARKAVDELNRIVEALS